MNPPIAPDQPERFDCPEHIVVWEYSDVPDISNFKKFKLFINSLDENKEYSLFDCFGDDIGYDLMVGEEKRVKNPEYDDALAEWKKSVEEYPTKNAEYVEYCKKYREWKNETSQK